MTFPYATPGVYIEELTGPGVIAGVGTSTAAFVGPALRGPLKEARRVTSFDDFLRVYALSLPDGSFQPYITSPRWLYLAHAVRGFFENGGQQAYIVRVGTAAAAAWNVENQDHEPVFQVQAAEEGVAGDAITIEVQATNATGAAGVAVATGSASVSAVDGLRVTVGDPAQFRVSDIVTKDQTARAEVTRIQGDVLTLSAALPGLAAGDTLRIAHITSDQVSFRMASVAGLAPGSVVQISGTDAATSAGATAYAVVEQMNRASGFVTLAASPARAITFSLEGAAPVLISQEFRLIVTAPGAAAETFDNLSLNPFHPGYVFTAVNSGRVRILPPQAPPVASAFPNSLVAPAAPTAPTHAGLNDDPAAVGATEYQVGLDVLHDIDDVNIVCIPDAAANADYLSIQQALIEHCLALRDRFAILDARQGAPPAAEGSVDEHRNSVEAERGFAALYYPWLLVRDPSSRGPLPRTLAVPPSGHIAGLYARIDTERGVHKSPANADVRGVLGLEQRLSDRQQGPLNLRGINVLRIFPGSAQVTVWGARTTVDPDITEWRYVAVRRLMLFLEESIEEGIRWAVFEPNNLSLWEKLKRTIVEFLTRVWRDGALFGATPEQAFYVRIDEALNPPATRALGRLYIEIGVAPVRPAEFIIVRIGLWDGGAEVSES
ncbi:MAG TPA: phage tail sheath subtilisin-like domain-containing protein [Roseiflexaceae bacterium]